MTSAEKRDHSVAVAEAVLKAVEQADLAERNIGLAELRHELPALSEEFDAERLEALLITAGCRCARDLVTTWTAACPDDQAPVLALEATEAWLAEPTPERALQSASLSQASLHSFASTRGSGHRSSWPAHAWFARACAWLADAPRHGWQSIAALGALIKAGARERLLAELAAQLQRSGLTDR